MLTPAPLPLPSQPLEFSALGELARATIWARRVAVWLFAGLLLSLIACLAVPWQQSVAGRGRVITYDPNHRLQEVDAPISGRLVDILPNLVEGMHVDKGEVLMKIELVDPILMERYAEQFESQKRKLSAEEDIVIAYEQNILAFKDVREQTELAQDEYVKVAEQKLLAEEENFKATVAGYDQAEKDSVRRKELFEQKVESKFEWELAVRKAAEAKSKLEQSKAYVKAAQSELAAKKAEREHKLREADAKIDSADAVYRKSQADVESTRKEMSDIQNKQSLQVQPVIAPLDGYILKLRSFQGGQIVTAGQPLLELVPSTADRAIEVKVDGNDAPLVASHVAGGQPRKVRLQFEGWPAVQFSGWPSVAVGTFGGIVATVDRTDDGQGKFRVVVIPDPEDRPWPDAEYLRQGIRVNGWVLLNNVPLGQELWRQMNGFPPIVSMPSPEKQDALLRGKK
jgi:adhesin transport system membrane fusion protein